jgi:hypothetical protein
MYTRKLKRGKISMNQINYNNRRISLFSSNNKLIGHKNIKIIADFDHYYQILNI